MGFDFEHTVESVQSILLVDALRWVREHGPGDGHEHSAISVSEESMLSTAIELTATYCTVDTPDSEQCRLFSILALKILPFALIPGTLLSFTNTST
jgi:hypothetical protein